MKSTLLFIVIAVLFAGLPCLHGSAGNAAEKAANTPTYMDLDGDGFNDLDADDNGNTIPDKFEPKKAEAVAEVSSMLGDVFDSPAVAPPIDEVSTSREEHFAKLAFKARDIATHRTGFNCNEGFGSGNGINLGAAVGGCEGGMCVRR